MNYEKIAKRIIALAKADLKLRQELIDKGVLFEDYHPEMEALHLKNAEELENIITEIGYPTIDRVGEKANEACWMIIQHAISNPTFMKKCERLLTEELNKGNMELRQLVYLRDRIATFEGKPQLYGTSFDWNEKGELSPVEMDDWHKVNERRKAIGLNSLEEQIEIMRQQAREENEMPPIDFWERKRGFDEWRKKVGWIE